jgi:uncharacterized repeat protein (TIGR04138 family)
VDRFLRRLARSLRNRVSLSLIAALAITAALRPPPRVAAGLFLSFSFVIVLIVNGVLAVLSHRRRNRYGYLQWLRNSQGLCPECSYDVRACKVQCPECGFILRSLKDPLSTLPFDHDTWVRRVLDRADVEEAVSRDALLFLYGAFVRAKQSADSAANTRRNVTASELCRSVWDYAVDYFGNASDAAAVLSSWNIRTGEDIDRLTRVLLDAKLMSRGENDLPEDFAGQFDLSDLAATSEQGGVAAD